MVISIHELFDYKTSIYRWTFNASLSTRRSLQQPRTGDKPIINWRKFAAAVSGRCTHAQSDTIACCDVLSSEKLGQ